MTDTARRLAHEDLKGVDTDAWIARLKRSVAERVQDGALYPEFPSAEIQRQFVGSAYEDALDEAGRFYRFAQESMVDRAYKRSAGQGYLDFGCGWGRIGRFFLRDFQAEHMAGVDIDPDMVAFCAGANLPGQFGTIVNGQPLPFADGQFRLVTAYSVFTHLPPHLFRAWLAELLRVLSPGGLLVFTVEPPRFLDFLESTDSNSDNAWHVALSAYKDQLPRMRDELARDGVAYLPSGGGAHRGAEIYGDTTVTAKFVAKEAAPHGGEVVRYVDDPAQFWQAAVVIRKREPRGRQGLLARLLDRLTGKA
ncbi:class I SAM-dependent methyltransferase [Caulobacter sp. RL271]|jgi:SAM-dependent methyltransferase|uniref:Class I SAM-dependent methyltransferase n=1 Tax=Caulobacter segnis TaxID=88688 RepID=A0ABY4ZV31_9CAUL|nr:class I SAM-dependent methyltransferase [Caulobacter segnis]USQ96558.1 class I SAM-dependent methyltransferase [Caulobacter segnis]